MQKKEKLGTDQAFMKLLINILFLPIIKMYELLWAELNYWSSFHETTKPVN